jgi:hypothetical protein
MLDGGRVSKSLNVSVKWDGAPALIFGPDPADRRFFVATKGAFAKTPKLAKTHADIDTMYASGVKNILHTALDELSKLEPGVVLQGDVLFMQDTLGQQSIDGKAFVTFQPNTILYAVDRESQLAQSIVKAALGIVIHTMYTGKGNSLAGHTSTAVSPTHFSQLKKTSRVLALDAAYDDFSGTATFTDEESGDFLLALENIAAASKLVPGSVYDLILGSPMHELLQQFLNFQVRQNRPMKPAEACNEFILFIASVQEKEMGARKSAAAKDAQQQKYAQIIDAVRRNQKALTAWFRLHHDIQVAKNIVVRKLGQASRISTFVRTAEGFRVTGPEGFVAVSRNGKAVKLVDRLEFSRLNFTAPKVWG